MTSGVKGKRREIRIDLPSGPLRVSADARTSAAIKQFATRSTSYNGMTFADIVKAVYDQGWKNGRREILEEIARVVALGELKRTRRQVPASGAGARLLRSGR